MLTLCAGLATAIAAPAQGQTASAVTRAQPQTASQSPLQTDSYYRLAEIIVGDFNVEKNTDRLIAAMVAEFQNNPKFAAMEVAFPGIMAAVTDAARPILIDEGTHAAPLYLNDLRTLYQQKLTLAEARQAATFMSSPAMVRFRELSVSELSMAPFAREMVEQKQISATAIENGMASAGIRAAGKLPMADRSAVLEFFSSPLGRKMVAFKDEKLAIDQKWANYVSPQGGEAIEAAIPKAMADYIAKTDPAAAQRIRDGMAAHSATAK